jgi:hypothetical protein
MTHLFFENNVEEFDEENAPDWLTSRNTIKGSTMDGRWFWNDHVLTLEVGKSIDTDFRSITRIS